MNNLVDVCPPFVGEKIQVFLETTIGWQEIDFRRLKKGDRFKSIALGEVSYHIAATNPVCGSLAEALDPNHSWHIMVDKWVF